MITGPANSSPARKQRLTLVHYPDPMLRARCEPVERFDIALRDIAEEMTTLMRSHSGILLTAPQVGLEHRMFVCHLDSQVIALVNAQLVEGVDIREAEEGCLSLPEFKKKVWRQERIRIIGYDVFGCPIKLVLTGLGARAVLHALDHLDGVLICDENHGYQSRNETH